MGKRFPSYIWRQVLKRNVISFSPTFIYILVEQLLCARYYKWIIFGSVGFVRQSFCLKQVGIHLCETDSYEIIHMILVTGEYEIYLELPPAMQSFPQIMFNQVGGNNIGVRNSSFHFHEQLPGLTQPTVQLSNLICILNIFQTITKSPIFLFENFLIPKPLRAIF